MEESITINELSIKAKSKNEIYRLRATERKNYLPLHNQRNHYYLSDIIHGKIKVGCFLIYYWEECKIKLILNDLCSSY